MERLMELAGKLEESDLAFLKRMAETLVESGSKEAQDSGDVAA